jgi:hypothetical protein
MAKRSTTTRTTNDRHAEVNAVSQNKADAIRAYKAEHPEARPADIVRGLAEQGVEVTASRVSTVLGNGSARRRTSKLTPAEQVRAASEFVSAYSSTDPLDAEEAIKAVGAFVERCGGSDAALEALAMYRELSAIVQK